MRATRAIRDLTARAALAPALAALVAVAAGCGGKHADTTPTPPGDEPTAPVAHAGAGELVPPETMDEIQRAFERKRPQVARCLGAAVDAKELPKGAAGKLTLAVVITGGKATTVTIARASLESKILADCVVGKVKDIAFPQLAAPYETSFTYGFEAM